MKTIDDALKYADTFDSPHSKHMSIVMLAAEVRRLRDDVNGLTGSLDRADKALKEAQQQPAVAWMIHEYQGTGEKRLQFQPHIPSIRDAVTGPIVTALYARPVPSAPAVPSGWNIRRDGDVLIVQHPDIGGCSVQKEPDWERMIPEAILYSLADALLQSAEVKS